MSRLDGLQHSLFEKIRAQLPPFISLVHEISETLGISYDSAYRRLRGEKELSIDEVYLLCSRYHISADEIFGLINPGTVFNTYFLSESHDGLDAILKILFTEISKLSGFQNSEFILVSRDLPLYFYFDFPDLVAFKLYFWNKILLHLPQYHNSLYSNEGFSAEMLQTGRQVFSIYSRVPSTEVWCLETFKRIISQIHFCCISGYFSRVQDALNLFDRMEALTRHIQLQTEAGQKFKVTEENNHSGEENFKVYLNDTLLIDTTGFVNINSKKTVFLVNHATNILVTTDRQFCTETEHSLRNITRTGSLISGTSELECNTFFNKIYENLNEARMSLGPTRVWVQSHLSD